VLVPGEGELHVLAGIGGLLRTAGKEDPAFQGQVIAVSASATGAELKEIIEENIPFAGDQEISYQRDTREVLRWTMLGKGLAKTTVDKHPWKDRGVYLIIGGLGELGSFFAAEIARKAKEVTLVLTGRSRPDSSRQAKIAALQQLGATVLYQSVNVANADEVGQLMQFIQDSCGSLRGIIHAAGTTADNYLINKSESEWNAVLASKVDGIQHLDVASKHSDLDLFIVFSSVAGAVGNAGQADYATANAFMDRYAAYRNTLVAKGLRRGQTLSINWPLWQEGGMQVDAEAKKYLFDSMGMVPLPTQEGIAAFYQALQTGHSQVMIIKGDVGRIHEKIISPRAETLQPVIPVSGPGMPMGAMEEVEEQAVNYFKKMLSSVIKLPAGQIRPELPMEEY